jgi:hypothetical protein
LAIALAPMRRTRLAPHPAAIRMIASQRGSSSKLFVGGLCCVCPAVSVS